MNNELKIKMYSFTIDCKDPQELAKFYSTLLKWEVLLIDGAWACSYAPGTNQGTYPCILFQQNSEYEPPVWPYEPKSQQQMAHLDFAVNDLERAVQYAIECGAEIAEKQFSNEWKVMLDPARHPFCLCQMKEIIESPNLLLL